MSEHVYVWFRGVYGSRVLKDGLPLSPERSQAVFNHSPDGFEWGYSGSGPAQLALALLLEEGCTNREALNWHQEFKRQVIAPLEADTWRLVSSQIWNWIDGQRADPAQIVER
jgi:hypothetical protein